VSTGSPKKLVAPTVLEIDGTKEKYFAVFVLIILLAFGTYKSIALFGAYPRTQS